MIGRDIKTRGTPAKQTQTGVLMGGTIKKQLYSYT
jgi:hypothetical protein